MKTFLEEPQDTEQPHGRREGAKKAVREQEISPEKLLLWLKGKKRPKKQCPCCDVWKILYMSILSTLLWLWVKASAQRPQKQRWSQNWHNLSLINFIWYKVCKGLLKKTMIKYRDFIVGFSKISKEHTEINQSTEGLVYAMWGLLLNHKN